MTIGGVAAITGVGVEAIRFYEREGLIRQPEKVRGTGHRQYDAPTVKRIVFIRRAKDLGFSLKEIKELLSLRVQSKAKCSSVRSKAEVKLQEVEKKLAELMAIKSALKELISCCDSEATTAECPILDALDSKVDL
ncbi:MAG: heavy metal-responsive transcriptional regulator [Proteobacteria bacterium]|nr:MAG: heavy metal-responsive transcriptional regulator [Pseudomonadota bacterium]